MAISSTSDPIDRAVRAWMAENGIDPNRVQWYRVSRQTESNPMSGMAILELKMLMNDFTTPPKPKPEPEPLPEALSADGG